MALYAARETSRKEPFKPDGELLERFERGFLFRRQPIRFHQFLQLKDMEDLPMDRLLVGDVGFRENEVAFRACRESCRGRKADCIPGSTTLLAVQHFESFSGRIAGLPIRASPFPFCSQKKAGGDREEISEGLVDVVFGTHRLLQGDINFEGLV